MILNAVSRPSSSSIPYGNSQN